MKPYGHSQMGLAVVVCGKVGGLSFFRIFHLVYIYTYIYIHIYIYMDLGIYIYTYTYVVSTQLGS